MAGVWQARVAVVLPPDPDSPARARQVLREVLAEADRLDCLDAAELACTELVTNAVLHAHTPIEVTVVVDDAVRVCVHDGSDALPRYRSRDRQATTGRGLALVAAITDAYGIADAGPGGKTMWFTVGGGPRERSEEDLLRAWAAADWDLGPDDGAVRADEARTGATVRLLALPTTLWFAARQHHDDLLRELTLHATRHPRTGLDLVGADHARAVLSAAVAAAVDGLRAGGQRVDDGVGDHDWRPVPIDLTLDVPVTMVGDFEALQDALDTAEDLARAGELLARPGLAEVIAVRDWACEQVVAQLAGIAPAAWPGLDDDAPDPGRGSEHLAGRDAASTAGPVHALVERVRTSDHGVAAADETNRIVAVSEPLARLLGWTVDDLVGRRIVALVPPGLREAHVAGFTRHQSTGEARILGVPLTVPVLRSDGTQVTCHLLIESAEHGPGGSLYLAWIGPVAEPAPSVSPDARPRAERAPA